jgi:hypothetical protein
MESRESIRSSNAKILTESTDPVERLKLVITTVIAGLHLTCTQAKPFNPILGMLLCCVSDSGFVVSDSEPDHQARPIRRRSRTERKFSASK